MDANEAHLGPAASARSPHRALPLAPARQQHTVMKDRTAPPLAQ